MVTVTDESRGIAAEHHAQVFDRFFRVPGQTAARRGTGVGLAIVRQYVKLHGGEISLQSPPPAPARPSASTYPAATRPRSAVSESSELAWQIPRGLHTVNAASETSEPGAL